MISRAFLSSSTAARKAISVCSASRGLSTYKTSTGLVGLAVDLNGRQTLLDVTAQTLDALKVSRSAILSASIWFCKVLNPSMLTPPSPRAQRIPATSAYRTDVEKWCNFFTKVASSTNDIKAIEKEIGLGQIEEVIEMVKDEQKLVDIYFTAKGWEMVADEQKRADSMVAAMADSIYFSSPPAAPAAAAPAPPK
jgi:ETC complex I subunit conserved region